MSHTVKLMAPQFVKPYVKTNKNDAADAEAICEAVRRPNMRFVAVKTIEQQDIQAVHRVRFELSNQRKAKGERRKAIRSVAWWANTDWLRPRNCGTCVRRFPTGWRMPRTA